MYMYVFVYVYMFVCVYMYVCVCMFANIYNTILDFMALLFMISKNN